MGNIDNPSSFRSVVLQESSMKLVESVWVQQNNDLLQSLIGDEQAAYKTGSGVQNGL